MPKAARQIKDLKVKWKTGLELHIDGRAKVVAAGATSMASTIIATVFTAPLNALKLMAITGDVDISRLNFRDLYRGYFTSVLKFGPRHAIEHACYTHLKDQLHHCVAGAVSTCLSVCLLHPLDRLHIRWVLKRSLTQGGSVFNGMVPSVFQSSINGFLWYGILEALKPHICNSYVLCGISSLVCCLITHPIDVLKTKCVADGLSCTSAAGILVRERAVYSGFKLALCTSIPSNTIAYGTYVLMSKCFLSK